MSSIDDLLALDIDEASHPWSKSLQDIIRERHHRRITDDEALRLSITTMFPAFYDFEERLNKLERQAEGLG